MMNAQCENTDATDHSSIQLHDIRDYSTEVVHRGLSLAGKAISFDGTAKKDTQPQNSDVADLNDDDTFYDPLKPPEDHMIDKVFDAMLNSGFVFDKAAINYLKAMPHKRKWAHICKAKNAEYRPNHQKDVNRLRQNDNDFKYITPDHQKFLRTLEKVLSGSGNNDDTKVLYHLEKLLRKKAMSSIFSERGYIKMLIDYATNVDRRNQYIYLQCLRTSMNNKSSQTLILESKKTLEYLCEILSVEHSDIICQTQALEILLLLTYLDDKNGPEIVFETLEPFMPKVISRLDKILRKPNFIFDESETPIRLRADKSSTLEQPSKALFKPTNLVKEYGRTFLFTVNSLIQGLATQSKKSVFNEALKKGGIQEILNLLLDYQDDTLKEPIAKFIENQTIVDDQNVIEGAAIYNISYGSTLRLLVEETKGNSLESIIGDLLGTVLKLIKKRKPDETVKLINIVYVIIDRLIDSPNLEESVKDDGLIADALDRLMDSLQSDHIARKAMNHITELQKNIEDQETTIKELRDRSQYIEKVDVLEELQTTKTILKEKNNEIERLQNTLSHLKEECRAFKRLQDHNEVHHGLTNSNPIKDNIFGRLKHKRETNHSLKSYRVESLTSLYPVGSLSDVCKEIDSSRTLSTTKVNTDLGNDNIESHASTNDSIIRKAALPHEDEYRFRFSIEGKPADHHTDQGIGLSRIEGLRHRSGDEILHEGVEKASALTKTEPKAAENTLNGENDLAMKSSEIVASDENKVTPIIENAASAPPPPPPPPLPNHLSSVTSKSKPSMLKLKQIHWEVIENTERTFWDSANSEDPLRALDELGVFLEIKTMFSSKNTTSKESTIKTLAKLSANKSFLPSNLAQQFGINLHMFSHLSVKEFCSKVLSCDATIASNVTALAFLAKDELIGLTSSLSRFYTPYSHSYINDKEPEKDPSELERADQIYLNLCFNLRSYWRERSQCLYVLGTYERDYYEILSKLQKVDNAVACLKQSKSFKRVLFMIVEIGNFMNNKPARGVRMKSLLKLALIKSTNGSNISFLHYIEGLLRRKFPELYNFMDDLKNTEELGNITLNMLDTECQEFITKINSLVFAFEKGSLSDPSKLHPDDLIIRKTNKKVRRAANKCTLLNNQYELTTSEVAHLLQYYGEDSNNSESKDSFFPTLCEFASEFRKCARENIEREETEKVFLQRQALLEMNNMNTKSGQKDNEEEEEEEEDIIVDQLLSKLKNAREPRFLRAHRKINMVPDINSGHTDLLTRTKNIKNEIQNI